MSARLQRGVVAVGLSASERKQWFSSSGQSVRSCGAGWELPGGFGGSTPSVHCASPPTNIFPILLGGQPTEH